MDRERRGEVDRFFIVIIEFSQDSLAFLVARYKFPLVGLTKKRPCLSNLNLTVGSVMHLTKLTQLKGAVCIKIRNIL